MSTSRSGPVAYVTDVEGQWERLAGFVARTPALRLAPDGLVLADGVTFVFGGDAVDRGPASRKIVRVLLAAKRRYGARVVLLAGNRDINKMRLVRELDGHPPPRAPPGLEADRPALLRFLFAQTMGAAEAFEHRAAELASEGLPGDDDSVVESVLADLAPAGDLTRYLAACELAYRHGETLFLHGGLTDESLGHVPGEAPVAGVDAWVERLNAWGRAQTDAFASRTSRDLAHPSWTPLLGYQPVLFTDRPRPSLASSCRIRENTCIYGVIRDT